MSSSSSSSSSNMLMLSLRNVFPHHDNEKINEVVTFMDNYLTSPQSHFDFRMTLKYCQYLTQLTDYFKEKMDQYIKLNCEFDFLIDLSMVPRASALGNQYRSTCHLIELVVRLGNLSTLVCVPLMNALKVHDKKPAALNQPPTSILKTSMIDIPLDKNGRGGIREQYDNVRHVLGLLFYCTNEVLPYARYVNDVLDSHSPEIIQRLHRYYVTLRLTGCWLQAALRFQNIKAITMSRSAQYPVAEFRRAIKNLRECTMVINASIDHSTPTAFIMLLQPSVQYEVYMQFADYIVKHNDDIPNDVALLLYNRAQAIDANNTCNEHGLQTQYTTSGVTQFQISNADIDHYIGLDADDDEYSVDVNAMRVGTNPLAASVFASPSSSSPSYNK